MTVMKIPRFSIISALTLKIYYLLSKPTECQGRIAWSYGRNHFKGALGRFIGLVANSPAKSGRQASGYCHGKPAPRGGDA